MALVDLKTDLKSLKFESGLNNKPFVVKDIDEEGGANSMLAVQGILASKRLDDTIRMAKLVIAKPGLSHVAKQAINAFINSADTKAQYEGGNFKLGKELIDKALDLLTTAVTNIGQTPLNGLGLHLHKGNLEFKGDAYRDYTKREFGGKTFDHKGRMITQGHSTNIAAGVKKTKKIPLNEVGDAANQGKINYKHKSADFNTLDGLGSEGYVRKTVPGGDSDKIKDLVDFKIYVYDQGNTEEAALIQFRALLDSFSDNFTANWNSSQLIGRPESFVNYTGFGRNVSIGFKIAAFSRAELMPLYAKLNYLVSTTAPTFSDDGLFMRGTLVRITLGDYLDKAWANIGTIGLNWQTNYPWEIRLDDGKEKDIMVLPHVLDVTLSADIHHDFIPQTGYMPYIGLNNQKFLPYDGKGPTKKAGESMSSFDNITG